MRPLHLSLCAVWLVCLRPLAAQDAIVQYGVVLKTHPASQATSPILVGASAALDCCSTNANWGRTTLQAWQVFVSWLSRRGGINVGGTWRPLEIHILDDASQPASVTAAYAQHVRDGKTLLLGPYGSAMSTLAADVANASGALLLCPRAPSTLVTQGRPTVFSTTPPLNKFTTSALEGLAANGAKTIAYIAEDLPGYAGQCTPLATAGQRFGMNLVHSQLLPPEPDANTTAAAVAQLAAKHADVVFACMQLQGCVNVAEAMVESAFFPKAVVLPTCTTTPTWASLGEDGLFFTGTTPWLPSMPLRSSLTTWTAQQFGRLYQAAYNEAPPFQAAAAFATLELLVAAIEKANSTHTEDILAQLHAIQLDTVYGKLQFDDNRQIDLDFLTVQATSGTDTIPPVISPLAFAQAPMRYPMPSAAERRCMRPAPSAFGYNSAGQCVECPAGYASIWNQSASSRSCFFCPPGFLVKADARCVACPPGTITITAGQPQCTNCSAGTYAAMEGASECTSCAAGTAGGATGATACEVCAPGKYNEAVQQTLCRDCVVGTFSAKYAARDCRPCEAGTFSEADGSSSCASCSGGRVTAQLGAWSAASCVCPRGSYWQQGGCAQCPPLQSTQDLGATSSSACSLVPAARVMIATLLCAAVVFPSLFCLAWARVKKKLRDAERLRLAAMERQLDSGLKTIREFQHPMVVISALNFWQMTDEDLQSAHETARDKGLLKSFDASSQVAAHRRQHPGCRIVLFSYEWLSWVRKGPNAEQAECMRRALSSYCRDFAISPASTYVWLDVLSVPQVNESLQALAVNSLYTYAASADALVVIAPPSWHEHTQEKANLDTYKKRVWTRMEQVAQVAAHGIESVFIATAEGDLEVATDAWIRECVDIFSGQMTCCRLKHKGRGTCDKESLVTPLLGVWYLVCGGEGPLSNSGAALLRQLVQARLGEVFPTTIAFETESGVEQRPLFGDLIPLLEKHLQRQERAALRDGCSHALAEDAEAKWGVEEEETTWGPDMVGCPDPTAAAWRRADGGLESQFV